MALRLHPHLQTPDFTLRYSKSGLQHLISTVANVAARSAEQFEADTLDPNIDPVATAKRVTDAYRSAKQLLQAAESEVETLSAMLSALSGDDLDASQLSDARVVQANEIAIVAKELRSLEPQSEVADLTETIAQLRQIRDTFNISVTTARKRFAYLEDQTRRANGSAFARLNSDADVETFKATGLHRLLPKHWPNAATPEQAKQLVKEAVSEWNQKRHRLRNDARRAKAVAQTVTVDAAVRAISELVR